MVRWLASLVIRLGFSAQMATHGVLSNPLRSALTILGVAIGVASVVSLMGIGEGAREAVVEQFKSLGSNVIVVSAHEPEFEFTGQDVEELVDRVSGMDRATPVVRTTAAVTWRRTRATLDILGVNDQFPAIRDHPLVAGNFFTSLHVQQRSPVVVLGYNVGTALMGGRDPSGQTLIIDGITYRIVGVLAPRGPGAGDGIDDQLVIPYTTAARIADKTTAEEIWAKANSAVEAELAVVQLGRIFRRKLGFDSGAPVAAPPGDGDMKPPGEPGAPGPAPAPMPERPDRPPEDDPGEEQPAGPRDLVTITSLNQLVREADQANRIMTLLLGGIAAVSLLVGGLGIMNIMLVAVTERTAEIGVRRAIGAKQGDLIIQFILEALYLSGTGAILGIIVGLWGLNLFTLYGFDTAVSSTAIVIAAGVALAAGLLFGVYPAFSASSVSPMEALRR